MHTPETNDQLFRHKNVHTFQAILTRFIAPQHWHTGMHPYAMPNMQLIIAIIQGSNLNLRRGKFN